HNGGIQSRQSQVGNLQDARIADYIICEADGAKGRSLKAHADHEPVVSHQADLVVAVIGIDCIGKPATEEHVHRSGLFCERVGIHPGSPISIKNIADIFFHPEGYLKNTGLRSEVVIFINKVLSATERQQAEHLALALKKRAQAGRVKAVVVSNLGSFVV
ncbi:MAG: putative selenium-dependent hydroxylase accessory protein YqeC, partial [Deltaproteobacteria bacterium]|nr:putative selenium-dependent hydroxylase accessory protein YqeC [Deltaproteobacteria bacterium]